MLAPNFGRLSQRGNPARDGGARILAVKAMEGEYQGRVKDGKLHGVGVCLYTDGSRFQGDWKAGLKSGRGTHSFASGDQFEGEWENGWMHGLGVYTWKIGDKYIGEVRAALRSLSGPAEDSCLSLARSCHFHVPCPCPCSMWYSFHLITQHGRPQGRRGGRYLFITPTRRRLGTTVSSRKAA